MLNDRGHTMPSQKQSLNLADRDPQASPEARIPLQLPPLANRVAPAKSPLLGCPIAAVALVRPATLA